MSETKVQYEPPKSLLDFFTSEKFISLQVGPVGSTKTTAGIMKIAYHAMRMAKGIDGIRRSRAVWVRRSRQMLFDTSIKDFLSWYEPGIAGEWSKTEAKFVLKFADVECEVLFRPMEDESDINRLLSLQVSFAIFDEFREISPAVFEAMQGRLGRYPDKRLVPPRKEWGLDDKGHPIGGCVTDDGQPNKHLWGMTNPPDADTYWEDLLTNPPDNVGAFFQPSGLSPEADWIKYLPDNYYEDLAQGKSEDYIDVYIHSKFGRSLSGQPVFKCFNSDIHVAKEVPTILSAPLIIGVDAGLNPSAVIAQVAYDGRLIVHDSITGNEGGMGALRFIREKLKPLLTNKYRGNQVSVIIDPAAVQRAQTDERSVYDIFKAEGFSIKPAKTNAVAARLAACESYMTRTVGDKPMLLVSPEASLIIQSLRGKYRYKINTKGERDDKPEKSHPWSDVCFVAGTEVATPNGGSNIEALLPGDIVIGSDGPEVVTHIGSHEADNMLEIKLSNGTTLVCTDDHPFAVNDACSFVKARSLLPGSKLVTLANNEWVRAHEITSQLLRNDSSLTIVSIKPAQPATVYNVTTTGTHTYYVGGALVHNCDAFQYVCLHADGGGIFGASTVRPKVEIKPFPRRWGCR